MLKVEVASSEVQVREFTKRDTGQEFTFFTQEAFMYTGGKYPVPFSLSVEGVDKGYDAGMYEVRPGSYEVNKGVIGLRRNLDLAPLQAAGLKAAS